MQGWTLLSASSSWHFPQNPLFNCAFVSSERFVQRFVPEKEAASGKERQERRTVFSCQGPSVGLPLRRGAERQRLTLEDSNKRKIGQ